MRHVVLLGIGALGARVARCLLERDDVRIVGVFARGRGLFDRRGLRGSVIAELAAHRSAGGAGAAGDALDFPASSLFLDALAALTGPIVLDCTAADGVEELRSAALSRGVDFASARPWLCLQAPTKIEQLLHESDEGGVASAFQIMGMSGRPDDTPSSRPGRARGEDSGVIDLDRLMGGMDEPARREEAPVVAKVAAAPAPAPANVEPPVAEADQSAVRRVVPMDVTAPQQIAPTNEPAVASVPAATRVEPAKRTSPTQAWLTVALTVAALVAAALIARRFGASDGDGATQAQAVVAAKGPAPAATQAAPRAAAPSATASARADEGSVAVGDIGSAKANANANANAKNAAPVVAATASGSLVDLGTASAAPGQDLGDAMRNAAGARDPAAAATAEAPTAPGFATLRPAAGALNAAISNAVRDARACLAADDAIVHATLTFAADGQSTVRVGKVSSSVPGAQACVAHALGTARVAPFVEAPLAVPVVVRP